jgi:hypothetical protein
MPIVQAAHTTCTADSAMSSEQIWPNHKLVPIQPIHLCQIYYRDVNRCSMTRLSRMICNRVGSRRVTSSLVGLIHQTSTSSSKTWEVQQSPANFYLLQSLAYFVCNRPFSSSPFAHRPANRTLVCVYRLQNWRKPITKLVLNVLLSAANCMHSWPANIRYGNNNWATSCIKFEKTSDRGRVCIQVETHGTQCHGHIDRPSNERRSLTSQSPPDSGGLGKNPYM